MTEQKTIRQNDSGAIFPPTNPQPILDKDWEQLCQIYWPPIYGFLRRQGKQPADAKDLTQGFLVHMLSRARLERWDPARCKFRSFLLACLKNYVANDRKKKPGVAGGQMHVPINTSEAETQYGPEPADPRDPTREFERSWALTLLATVLQQLKQKYAEDGRAQLFEVLHPYLTGDAERGDYKEAAAKLSKSEAAVRQDVHRLRKDYDKSLRAEVGRTVRTPAEIDDEIRDLFSVLS